MTDPIPIELCGDLVEVASQPGFRDWLDMVRSTGGCANPIHLWGESRTVHVATGEVLNQRSPGRLLIACGNRRLTRCPSCSETYRADTYQLIKAGLIGGKSVPDSVAFHPRVFATFTAPSFGPVHHAAAARADASICHPHGPTRCGQIHLPNDPVIGQALDPAGYDYVGAVMWNALATRLWARTVKLTNRRAATLLSVHQRDWASTGRVSAAKVAEYQARGLVHFHAIFRLDGPVPDQAPPAAASVEVLADAIRRAASIAVVPLPDCAELAGRAPVSWGSQLDLRPVGQADNEGRVHDTQVAGYIAKYATKGAEVAGTVDRPIACATCAGLGRLREHQRTCPDCSGSGLRIALEDLNVSDHGRVMIQTCWQLGGIPELQHLRLRPWAHMLGFRGHFSTKTRGYSTTLGDLRGARQRWRTHKILRAHGLDETTTARRVAEHELEEITDNDQVLLVGSWVYSGRGHSPGEALYAATIAADIAESRRAARQTPPDDWEA